MLKITLSKREKTIALITTFLMATFALDWLIIKPLSAVWKDLDQTITTKKVQLRKFRHILDRHQRLSQDYQSRMPSFQQTGTVQEEMARFLKEIESTARKSSVKIIDIKPLPTEDREFYKDFAVTIEVQLTWAQMIKFIDQLNQAPQPLQIEKLSLRTQKSSQRTLRARMIINKGLIFPDDNEKFDPKKSA